MTPRKSCTGLLGGSFNPIHNGHLAIARAMLAQGIVDEVMIMVSPQNPLKSRGTLLDERTRYSLAALACEEEEGIHASDFEFSLPRPSYTWHTLEALKNSFPEKTFKLLIGADNWQLFPRWYRAGDILDNYAVAVYPRPGYDIDASSLPANAEYVDMPLLHVSSTEIRQSIKEGKDVSALLPPKVYDQIKSLGLYA